MEDPLDARAGSDEFVDDAERAEEKLAFECGREGVFVNVFDVEPRCVVDGAPRQNRNFG